jgi:3-oxoacyl-[acyl-carrier protein] reductase
VKAFAQLGATVVCSGTTEEKSVQIARQLAEEFSVPTMGVGLDVTNFNQSQDVIDRILSQYQRLDILVNNAGITKDNLVLRMSEQEWDSVLSTNLYSVFNLTKPALKPMLKQRFGRIINMSSVVGIIGNSGQAHYVAAKSGMIGFTKSIAKEYASKGITCNAIAPGFIQTDMIDALPKEYLDNIMSSILIKRLGSVEDIAQAAVFLASASYVTGQVLSVDGGMAI